MTPAELRTEIARLAGLLAHEVGNTEAQIVVERIGRRIGLQRRERTPLKLVTEDVAHMFCLPVAAIMSRRRDAATAKARLAAYREASRHGYSQSEIARHFGRTPSTILKGLKVAP